MQKTPEYKRQFFDGFTFTQNNGKHIYFRHSPLRKMRQSKCECHIIFFCLFFNVLSALGKPDCHRI